VSENNERLHRLRIQVAELSERHDTLEDRYAKAHRDVSRAQGLDSGEGLSDAVAAANRARIDLSQCEAQLRAAQDELDKIRAADREAS
jgi:multidrug resistance efflux pump